MPTYDYKCLDCGYTFEYFQQFSDEHLTNCPKCNGTLKRLIGAGSGPIFKGSGFYQTDYKNKPKKSDRKLDKSEIKPAEKKSDSSPEKKQ